MEGKLFEEKAAAAIKVGDWVQITTISGKRMRGVVLRIVAKGDQATDRYSVELQDEGNTQRVKRCRWVYGHMLAKIEEPARVCRHCGKSNP